MENKNTSLLYCDNDFIIGHADSIFNYFKDLINEQLLDSSIDVDTIQEKREILFSIEKYLFKELEDYNYDYKLLILKEDAMKNGFIIIDSEEEIKETLMELISNKKITFLKEN